MTITGAEVYPPEDLGFTPLARVFRDGDATTTDFVEAVYDVDRDTTYYVDAVGGSDSNNGLTTGTAVKTIDEAISIGNASGGSYEIVLMSVSGYVGGFGTTSVSQDVTVKSQTPGTIVYVANGQVGGNFSLHGGSTYSRSHSALHVWDCKFLDSDGAPSKLPEVADAAAVEAQPGSFAVVGGITYIHTQDSRVLDNLVLTGISNVSNRLKLATISECFVRDVAIVGATRTAFDATVDNAMTICLVNFRADYTFSTLHDAVVVDTRGTCILSNCSVTNTGKDGANYKPRGGDLNCLEVGFHGANCGAVGSDNTNASTTHLGTKMVRVGGFYDARHRPIHDIQDGCQSWCVDVECTAGTESGTGYTTAAIAVGNSVADTSKMWIDGGRFSGANRFTAFLTAEMYLKNVSTYGSTGNVFSGSVLRNNSLIAAMNSSPPDVNVVTLNAAAAAAIATQVKADPPEVTIAATSITEIAALEAAGIGSGGDSEVTTTKLSVFQGETVAQSITAFLADGTTPLDLSGLTLEMVFENNYGKFIASIGNADITISGANSNIVTFFYPADVTRDVGPRVWSLRDANDRSKVRLNGTLQVVNSAVRD